MRSILKKSALLLAGALILSSCSEDDDQTTNPVAGPQSLTTIIADDARFTVLVDALERTGLDATLDGAGTFTVFAPTDMAFTNALTALGYADLDALEAGLGTDGLKNVLLYHVLGAKVPSADVSTGYVSTAAMNADGDALSLYISTMNGVQINGSATVRETDINASNGVAHVIDAVILPLSMYELISVNPEYSSLDAALMVADGSLDSVLTNMGDFTLFAPDNAAFQAVIDATPGVNDLNDLVNALGTDGLATVLLYHVTNGIILSADLPNLSSNTVNTLATDAGGSSFTFDLDIGTESIRILDGNSDTDPSTIVEVDVVGTNGALHFINAVILPQ